MSTRKALVVGINYYDHIGSLTGCVNDARAVQGRLDRNADASVNFAQPKVMLATNADDAVSKAQLKDAVRQLFADDNEVALFYFTGHGHLESTGRYLCASECCTGDDGLPLSEIMALANQSRSRNKLSSWTVAIVGCSESTH